MRSSEKEALPAPSISCDTYAAQGDKAEAQSAACHHSCGLSDEQMISCFQAAVELVAPRSVAFHHATQPRQIRCHEPGIVCRSQVRPPCEGDDLMHPPPMSSRMPWIRPPQLSRRTRTLSAAGVKKIPMCSQECTFSTATTTCSGNQQFCRVLGMSRLSSWQAHSPTQSQELVAGFGSSVH
jgi:hypothetical protein